MVKTELSEAAAFSEVTKSKDNFRPRLRALVELDKSRGRVVSVNSIVTYVRDNGDRWEWNLSLKSFEPVHGMSRVVLLVPDKLRTATAINAEQDLDDDGRFLVDLILKLCFFYRDQVESRKEAEAASLESRRSSADRANELPMEFLLGGIDEIGGGLDFSESIAALIRGLEEFKTLLEQRADQQRLFNACDVILELSVDLFACSQAFLCFNHPIWIQVSRSGERLTPEEQTQLSDQLLRKLEGCRKRIYEAL